jgi:hypothetical protein
MNEPQVISAMQTETQAGVEALARAMARQPQIVCPLDHEFTGQFYVRTIHVSAGRLVVSRVFKEEFPFFISKGRVSIWIEGVGIVRREAPFWGSTQPATRRIIMHHTDVEWTTFHHVGELRDVEEIEERVTMDSGKLGFAESDQQAFLNTFVKQLRDTV